MTEALALGPTLTDAGAHFVLHAPDASRVDLCLFANEHDASETRRIAMRSVAGDRWHCHVEGATAETLYGYRLAGEYAPERGRFANPAKLLLDPWAREIRGNWRWTDAHVTGHETPDARNNAGSMFKGRVGNAAFDWEGVQPPAVAWPDTVLYELHVKGFTARHPDIPPEHRGRFRGLATPVVIDYLSTLGVTTVELLPVQAFVSEAFAVERGLTNYWGYNPVNWFAPHPAYGTPQDFRRMVKALHGAGIEVVLDVVFNHTAEAGADGPVYNFKSLANSQFYRLHPDNAREYINDTGCGNTVDTTHPVVVQHVLDALRYWVEHMHVDGFRFDLATVLGRCAHGFDPAAPLLEAMIEDPCLGRVKLIAEPWDLGPDGYQLGSFPPPFAEWNARFRDDLRDVWLTRNAGADVLARRLTGSADVFRRLNRTAYAGINFIASHDGFTLLDLVTYQQKRNDANGENNRDGHDDNRNWNAGEEGPSTDQEVIDRRGRLRRAMMTCLFVSQGTPMLMAGDESGRTQQGNNNAYCQDNDIGWLDWSNNDESLLQYVRALISLRTDHPRLGHTDWFDENDPRVCWYREDGEPMTTGDWHSTRPASLALHLTGNETCQQDLLVLFNATDECRRFALPSHAWQLRIDSVTGCTTGRRLSESHELGAHGVAVLEAPGG